MDMGIISMMGDAIQRLQNSASAKAVIAGALTEGNA
jgi:hypothetical protein